jgi:hypothetical protein
VYFQHLSHPGKGVEVAGAARTEEVLPSECDRLKTIDPKFISEWPIYRALSKIETYPSLIVHAAGISLLLSLAWVLR